MLDDSVRNLSDLELLKAVATIVDLVLKLAIALLGFYFAHSLGRQIAIRVSEKRLGAYSSLWSITGAASPVRMHLEEGGARVP